MLSAKLANLGYSDIKVSLAGVTYGGRDPKQDGGIADDGKISYFFLSPADKTSALDYSLLRQFTPTYTLTLGSESVSYTPGRASTLAWDGGKVVAYLKAAWAHVEGLPDEIEADVAQGTLPSSISINGVKVASINWMSHDRCQGEFQLRRSDGYVYPWYDRSDCSAHGYALAGGSWLQ